MQRLSESRLPELEIFFPLNCFERLKSFSSIFFIRYGAGKSTLKTTKNKKKSLMPHFSERLK